MSDSRGHYPTGQKWEFDGQVTEVFEDMLRRSIPDYDEMRKIVNRLALAHVKTGTDVVDIGCSRGDAVQPLVDRYGAQVRFVLADVSEPMLEVCRSRYHGWIETGVMRVMNHDLRQGIPASSPSLVLSILTLQFVPIEHRHRVVADVYRRLVPGGAFIVVEKVLAKTSEMEDKYVELHHEMKREAGYSTDEIDRKRLSLEGVLVPVTSDWNEDMLRNAGFRTVEQFWQLLNFAGWIAIK